MKKSASIHILIADDHLVVRMGLKSLINSQAGMSVIADASNGREAVELFRKHQPDILLLDLRMPDLNGVEVATAIRKEFPDARIIVLTTYDGDENIYRALQAGARAYLLKDVSREEFLRTIQEVHAGQYRLPPEVTAQLIQRVGSPELTQRELEVLRLIVKGMSNKEIAFALSVTESTVKNHVNALLAKLHVQDRTQAATSAVRRGIVQLD